jgi:hypothetical protein
MAVDSTQFVELWCLDVTPVGGVALTVTSSDGSAVAPITVNCATRPIPAIRIPGSTTATIYTGTTDYDAESCSTNVAGTSCSLPPDPLFGDQPNVITLTCGAGAPVGPVTATVVGSDPAAMNGTNTIFQFDCF